MNISKIFILRPVATILLSLGLFIAGAVAYLFLPVAPLPNIDIPAIVVFANRPGADPATMANSIAAPLERRLGEIGGIDELDSVNSTGASTIVCIFDFDKNIEDAAHDVQAAINAAQSDLPSDLPIRPFYKKINPTDSPIITIAMASDTLSVGQVYEAADTIMAQRLSQVPGVSQVQIEGGQTPAVRVQLDPGALRAAGISSQDVLTAIRNANVLQPTGSFEGPVRSEEIRVNGQIAHAIDYGRVVLKASNGAVLRLSDVAHVVDGVTNTRLAAWHGSRPAIILNVSKVAGANVIETVDRIKKVLPQLTKWISPEIHVTVLDDRTTTIRASTQDVQITLLITGALVLLTVLLFLRRIAATLAAAVDRAAGARGHGVRHVGNGVLAQQLFADVDYRVGRFRGGRCDRHDREHHPHARAGHEPHAGRDRRIEADRVYRDFHHAVARRGVHSAAVHGQHIGQDLPRIRVHADHRDPGLGRGVADADADGVRAHDR